MNIKHGIAALLLVLTGGLTSCVETTCPVENGSAERAVVGFRISLAPLETRALSDGDAVTPNAEETTIYTLHAFIFDLNGQPAALNGGGVQLQNLRPETPGSSLFVCDPLTTTSGPKRIWIVANLPADISLPMGSAGELLALHLPYQSMVGKHLLSGQLDATLPPSGIQNPTPLSITLSYPVAKFFISAAADKDADAWTVYQPNSNASFWRASLRKDPTMTNTSVVQKMQVDNIPARSYLIPGTTHCTAGGLRRFTQTDNISYTAVIESSALSVIESLIQNLNPNASHYLAENLPATPTHSNTTAVMMRSCITAYCSWAVKSDGTGLELVRVNPYYGALANDIIVVRHGGRDYVCNETNAPAVAAFLQNWTGQTPVRFRYTKGIVYFRLYLNLDDGGAIRRGQFIHLRVNGVNKYPLYHFPGYPEGVDPLVPTPDNPYPLDPDGSVYDTPAELQIEVGVRPWQTKQTTQILE